MLYTEHEKKDWHQRLCFGVHAVAIMDRIVNITIRITAGGMNMRGHNAHTTA